MGKAKVAILGGSRGLGACLVDQLLLKSYDIWMASRKPFKDGKKEDKNFHWHPFDFSQKQNWSELVENLNQFQPDILIYCAGGGPYARFGEKEWKDQEWAFKVTFECAAFLVWNWCRENSLKTVRQFIVIGSSVAESQPDPMAAMYCASKHALKGLISSLQKEYPQRNLQLFSAPYMDTQMLPPGAWPRKEEGLVRPPALVAEQILKLMID